MDIPAGTGSPGRARKTRRRPRSDGSSGRAPSRVSSRATTDGPLAPSAARVATTPRSRASRSAAASPSVATCGPDSGGVVGRACGNQLSQSQFRVGVRQRILPALDAFRPELVLISAGFDAHKRDPLAQLLLDEGDYTWITEQLLEIAYRHAGGRLVSSLEGGYDLAALAASVAAHVRVLMSV